MSTKLENPSKELKLTAPLSGPLVKLENVPDPVFAQKMVGDGISIDPTSNVLLSPCTGNITQVHPSHHAVTIMTKLGVEVMIHIGIDTVSLKGAGFTPKVSEGETVKPGDELIEFDMDYIATNAKSVLTQIIVTNSEHVKFEYSEGIVKAGKDVVLNLCLKDNKTEQANSNSKFEPVVSKPITIGNPTGLHARPSAMLSHCAKKFCSEIEIVCGDKKGNAKSTTAVMKMEVGNGESVIITARGEDANKAVEELTELICNGLGEDVVSADTISECLISEEKSNTPKSDNPNELLGIAASPGIAIGNVLRLKKEVLIVEEYGSDDSSVEEEILTNAITKTIDSLKGIIENSDSDESEIFEAHIELLDDPELIAIAKGEIAKGKSAGYAWQKAYTQQVSSLASLKNELLAGRANDMRDIGERTLRTIIGIETKQTDIPENTILIAEDLTPSQTATLDRSKVLGFCTVQGGASSHVAILARSFDIPAIAGIEERIMEIADGTPIIINGATGLAEINPSEERINKVKDELLKTKAKKDDALKNCSKPAITVDGHQVKIVGNAGGLEEIEQSAKLGGEGIGLLRSEFIFQNRSSAPNEDEQAKVYSSMAKTLGPERPLVIRTLDVGGDKPLPYLPIPKEENPFLGERGIRVCLDRPKILRTQFRAILNASKHGTIEVMFPMISSLEEFRNAKNILAEECEALDVPMVKTGIMVEVPVVAAMAEQFAKEVDFFSVGTNDLAQYTMAVDRGHPKLARLADGLTPGLLKLIAMATDAAHKYGKTISVCGGIASDTQAVPILIGLGIDKLSVTVPAIPTIKAQIRELSLEQCKQIADKALKQESAQGVRELVDATCLNK